MEALLEALLEDDGERKKTKSKQKETSGYRRRLMAESGRLMANRRRKVRRNR